MGKKKSEERVGTGIKHRCIDSFEFAGNEFVEEELSEGEDSFQVIAKGPDSIVIEFTPIEYRDLIDNGHICSLDDTDLSSSIFPRAGQRKTVPERRKSMARFWEKTPSLEAFKLHADGCRISKNRISLGSKGQFIVSDGLGRSSAIEHVDKDHPVFANGTKILGIIGIKSSKRTVAEEFLKENECRVNVKKSTNGAVSLATIEEGEEIGLEDRRYPAWVTRELSEKDSTDSMLAYLGWSIEGSKHVVKESPIPTLENSKSFTLGNLSSIITIFSENTIRSLIKVLEVDPSEVPNILNFGLRMWNRMCKPSIFELLQKGKSSRIRMFSSLGLKTICGLTIGVWKSSGYDEERFVALMHKHITSVYGSNPELFEKECLSPNDLWHTHKVLSGEYFNSGALNAEKGLAPMLRPFLKAE